MNSSTGRERKSFRGTAPLPVVCAVDEHGVIESKEKKRKGGTEYHAVPVHEAPAQREARPRLLLL